MRQGIFFLFVAALAIISHAQPVVPLPMPNVPNGGDERSRIETERVQARDEFEKQTRVCYAKFAVFDCIAQARSQQRLLLDALRRQEVVLNQLAREQKVQARLARLQGKATNSQESVP